MSDNKSVHTHAHTDSTLEIPIFTKLYEFYKNLYETLKKFPKHDRYTLGQKIENNLIEIFEMLSLANNSGKNLRLEILLKINAKLDLEKILLRFAKDNRCTDAKTYLRLQENLQEIGKMLGGWIRYLKNL